MWWPCQKHPAYQPGSPTKGKTPSSKVHMFSVLKLCLHRFHFSQSCFPFSSFRLLILAWYFYWQRRGNELWQRGKEKCTILFVLISGRLKLLWTDSYMQSMSPYKTILGRCDQQIEQLPLQWCIVLISAAIQQYAGCFKWFLRVKGSTWFSQEWFFPQNVANKAVGLKPQLFRYQHHLRNDFHPVDWSSRPEWKGVSLIIY